MTIKEYDITSLTDIDSPADLELKLKNIKDKISSIENHLVHEGYTQRDIIEKGLDSFEVEIYDFSDNTSFTDTFELLAIQFVDDGL